MSASVTASVAQARRADDGTVLKGIEMLWLALEIALGLALFVAIVWWTLPRKRRDEPPQD